MSTCAATPAGGPCGAPALTGSTFCWWHDPSRELERAAASAKGGRAPRRIRHLDVRRLDLDTPEKIAAVVESYVRGPASGRATAAHLKAVVAAAHVLLQALEAGAVRRDLDELKGWAKAKGMQEIRVDVPR